MTDKTTPERQPVADALPPLPASQAFSLTRSVYTADQMRAYASAALASRDAEIARVHAAYCHSQQQFLDAQAELAKLRQGEAVALPNCTVADVGFRWDGDKREHIPQVLVSFTPVPANRPDDGKGWKDRDAFAGMLASPPPSAGSAGRAMQGGIGCRECIRAREARENCDKALREGLEALAARASLNPTTTRSEP